MEEKIRSFLNSHWDNCICTLTEDDGPNIGLPYPYSVPTETDKFRNLFYWDTYFTNIGLILSDRAEQAKNNTDDMLFLVDKYGYVPNANSIHMLICSQPPVLSLAVRDVFDNTGDKKWLAGAFETLKKEYSFWMTRRIAPNGINCYRGEKSANPRASAEYYCGRTGFDVNTVDIEKTAADMRAEGESGWDYTPRFNGSASTFAAVELNSLLYAFEKNMEYFSSVISAGEEKLWSGRAEERAKKMREFFWNDEKKGFYDRDYLSGEWSRVFSASSYFALMCGAATEAQAAEMVKRLSLVEFDGGISCCEKNETEGIYQWDYPNCWAPVVWGVVKGLKKYGYATEAERVAEKYCRAVESCFAETGNLWEKYSAIDGSINVCDEYEMPPMLGWSAGVYLFCAQKSRKCK